LLLETKWVNAAEADIVSGRRDWLGGIDEEFARKDIFGKVKALVIG
jgi:amino acid transporter